MILQPHNEVPDKEQKVMMAYIYTGLIPPIGVTETEAKAEFDKLALVPKD